MFDDIRDQTKGRHYVLASSVDVLPAVDDHVLELILAHVLERVDQSRGIGATSSIRAVATQAALTIEQITMERVDVDSSVFRSCTASAPSQRESPYCRPTKKVPRTKSA